MRLGNQGRMHDKISSVLLGRRSGACTRLKNTSNSRAGPIQCSNNRTRSRISLWSSHTLFYLHFFSAFIDLCLSSTGWLDRKKLKRLYFKSNLFVLCEKKNNYLCRLDNNAFARLGIHSNCVNSVRFFIISFELLCKRFKFLF